VNKVAHLLEVFAKTTLQELGVFVEQLQLEIIHHGCRVSPALDGVRHYGYNIESLAKPTSMVWINNAMSSLILSSSSALVTPSRDLVVIRMMA
jgi:hypothetical protein